MVINNLAAHVLGGFFSNFSPLQRFCCFCNCSQESLKANLPSLSFSPRTSEAYDNNALNIYVDKALLSVYGIDENSSLNCLQDYYVINGVSQDITNNMLEACNFTKIKIPPSVFFTFFSRNAPHIWRFCRWFLTITSKSLHTIGSFDTWNSECRNKLLQLFCYWPY